MHRYYNRCREIPGREADKDVRQDFRYRAPHDLHLHQLVPVDLVPEYVFGLDLSAHGLYGSRVVFAAYLRGIETEFLPTADEEFSRFAAYLRGIETGNERS